MQNDLSTSFLVYAALFRISIVAAGALGVVLGYRLLAKGIDRGQTDQSLEASVGSARVMLRNMAPGTVLAVFGMTVIGVMVYQGMPELRTRAEQGTQEVVLRGNDNKGTSELVSRTERALKLHQAGDTAAATEAYEQTLDLLVTPTNNLAGLYLQQNRNTEALALARIAADLRPTLPNVLDTFADALAANGRLDEALAVAERAARLDGKYQEKLATLRSKAGR